MSLHPYAFVLAVPDLSKSSDYFQRALGFRLEWQDGTNWHALSLGEVRLMLGHCPDAIPPSEIGDHSYFGYWEINDVDAFHREILERGAIVLHPPTDRPWGKREMAIATPDGHRIMVGQPL
jgi:catechol 2,3-dioxygenase-like lactoylglutathione lyase family enzyme